MVLLIDNYDSFSYNLYQYFGSICGEIKAVRNDALTTDEIEKINPTHLVLSPGPGYPKDAGICLETVRRFAGKIPILGVCLGHQTIGEAFGAKVGHAPKLMHGRTSEITADTNCPLFRGIPEKFKAARYHSLVVKKENLPLCLKITARDGDGEIMGLCHMEYPVFGIQFHPESFMTEHGHEIIENFLKIKMQSEKCG